MTQFDHPEQTHTQDLHHLHHPLCVQQLPDFDLDIYRHLFSQDLLHSASSSLELDCSHFPSPFQLSDPITNNPASSLSLSSTHSSSSVSSSSASSTAPPHHPSNQPTTTSSLSSPSWSSLDQLFLASLPHHPLSSPLFPLDLIPNTNPISPLDPPHHQPLNQLNRLSDFSFDAPLHPSNLSFEPLHPLYSAHNPPEYQSPLRSSDCFELTENDPHQPTETVLIPEHGSSPSEQYLKHSTNPATLEGHDYEDFLLSSINTAPTHFTSPPPRQSTPYTPSSPTKRLWSSYSQAEDDASLLGPADLCSVTHNSSIAIDQLLQSDQKTIPPHPLVPTSKRPKNRTTGSSSKTHICPECRKSFPRLTSLTQHKLTHNGERPFPCGFQGCNKSFTTSSNMKRHLKTHV